MLTIVAVEIQDGPLVVDVIRLRHYWSYFAEGKVKNGFGREDFLRPRFLAIMICYHCSHGSLGWREADAFNTVSPRSWIYDAETTIGMESHNPSHWLDEGKVFLHYDIHHIT